MEEENKNNQSDFENLPFESQMKVLKVRRNLEQMTPHIEEIGKRMRSFEALLDCAREIDDPKKLRGILFSGAEGFEAMKPIPPDEGFPKERAKELDWLRHVLDDKPERVKDAVEALEKAIEGDFEMAWQMFDTNVSSHRDEFQRIVSYWKNALEQ